MEEIVKKNRENFTQDVFENHFVNRMRLVMACEIKSDPDIDGNKLIINCIESDGPCEWTQEMNDFLYDIEPLQEYTMDCKITQKVRAKMLNFNRDRIYGKLLCLSNQLWKIHGIAFLHNFSCCGSCSWAELRSLFEKYKPLGIIAWYTQNDLLENCDNAYLLSYWRDEMEEDDTTAANFEKYIIPLLKELKIEYITEKNSLKILFDGFNLPNFLPSDFKEE